MTRPDKEENTAELFVIYFLQMHGSHVNQSRCNRTSTPTIRDKRGNMSCLLDLTSKQNKTAIINFEPPHPAILNREGFSGD